MVLGYKSTMQRRCIHVNKMENMQKLKGGFESLFQKAEEQESKIVDLNPSMKWIRIPFPVCSKNVSKKTRFESLIIRIRIPIPIKFFKDIDLNP